MNIKYSHFLVLILAVFLVSSCKSKKGLTTDYKDKTILTAIENHNIDYDWFTAVGKINMSTPDQSIGAKIYLRMQKDSAIWMVVKKLGIEVARAFITPEEFTIIYRWEKVYEQESLQTLLESFNADLSFTELQDYLAGNIPSVDKTDFRTRKVAEVINCETKLRGLKAFLKLDAETLRLNSFEVFNQKNESVKGEYENHQQVNNLFLPFKRTFFIQSMEYGDMKATMNFSELQINEPKSMKFSIPTHYEKLKYYRPF